MSADSHQTVQDLLNSVDAIMQRNRRSSSAFALKETAHLPANIEDAVTKESLPPDELALREETTVETAKTEYAEFGMEETSEAEPSQETAAVMETVAAEDAASEIESKEESETESPLLEETTIAETEYVASKVEGVGTNSVSKDAFVDDAAEEFFPVLKDELSAQDMVEIVGSVEVEYTAPENMSDDGEENVLHDLPVEEVAIEENFYLTPEDKPFASETAEVVEAAEAVADDEPEFIALESANGDVEDDAVEEDYLTSEDEPSVPSVAEIAENIENDEPRFIGADTESTDDELKSVRDRLFAFMPIDSDSSIEDDVLTEPPEFIFDEEEMEDMEVAEISDDSSALMEQDQIQEASTLAESLDDEGEGHDSGHEESIEKNIEESNDEPEPEFALPSSVELPDSHIEETSQSVIAVVAEDVTALEEKPILSASPEVPLQSELEETLPQPVATVQEETPPLRFSAAAVLMEVLENEKKIQAFMEARNAAKTKAEPKPEPREPDVAEMIERAIRERRRQDAAMKLSSAGSFVSSETASAGGEWTDDDDYPVLTDIVEEGDSYISRYDS